MASVVSDASDARLYEYLVRLAVLERVVTLGPAVAAPRVAAQARTQGPPLTVDKLPRGILKALVSEFHALATAPGPSQATVSADDTFQRRVYLSFYALLLDLKQRDTAAWDELGRRAELLVARFVGCVSKELQNYPDLGPPKAVVNRVGGRFIELLRQTCNSLKGSSTLDSQLAQLAAVEFNGGGGDSNGSGDSTGPAADSAMGELEGLAPQVAKVCLTAPSELRRDLAAVGSGSVVTGERRHLQSVVASLERGEHPAYPNGGSSTEWWKAFEAAEVPLVRQLLDQLAAHGTSSAPVEVAPQNLRAFYALLVRRVLETGSGPRGGSLDDGSVALLEAAMRWWRVPAAVVYLVIAEAVLQLADAEPTKDASSDSSDSILMVATDALEVGSTMIGQFPPPSGDPDVRRRVKVLETIRQTVIYRMVVVLKQVFEPKPPKLGPLLALLEAATPPGGSPVSGIQLKQLKQALIGASEAEYDRLLSQVPRDSSLDARHVVDLAETLVAIAQRLQKRYKQPLLDELPIAKVVCGRQLKLFGTDFAPMYRHAIQGHTARNDAPAFDDMLALHDVLAQMQSLYVQCTASEFGMGFDAEATLFPYFDEWASTSMQLARSWVEPAINQDNWEPLEASAESRHSSSVADLFTSFWATLRLVERLEWQNQYHVAKLLTRIVAGVSSAVGDYAGRLHLLFLAQVRPVLPARPSSVSGSSELDVESVSTKGSSSFGSQSYQSHGQWLAALAKDAAKDAKDAMAAAAGHHKPPPPPDTHISAAACVQLNDVAAAYAFLDKMEASVSADAVARRIEVEERRNRPGTSGAPATTYLFTVSVVGANALRTWGGGSYVTLIDQDTRKRLGKTRTVLSGASPRWNQPFELEVTAGRPRLLKATVWDENVATQHELCGRALLKLDPKEFVGREWGARSRRLDLDTQGQLQVHISMDLRRDDIRFHFGQALRYLRRTQEDMVGAVVAQFDAYIAAVISPQTLRALVPARQSLAAGLSWFSSSNSETLTPEKIEDGLQPLFDYLNANFATLATVLSQELKLDVMSRTWDCVLERIESLILGPLEGSGITGSHHATPQLGSRQMESVYTWLSALRDFFHNDGAGPDLERLQSQAYQQIMAIPVYYDLPTPQLKSECDKIMRQGMRTYTRNAELLIRQSTVMAHRSRSVIDKQAAEIRRAQRAAPRLDDVILRILRMRGEGAFVDHTLRMRERLLQKESTERAIQGLA